MGNIDVGKKYIMNKTRVELKCYQLEPALMSTIVTFIGDIIGKTIERHLKIVVNFVPLDPKHY